VCIEGRNEPLRDPDEEAHEGQGERAKEGSEGSLTQRIDQKTKETVRTNASGRVLGRQEPGTWRDKRSRE